MPTWADVVRIGTSFPGMEEGTWFGTPALKVGGKGGICRLRTDPDALVMRVADMGEREALLQGQPERSSPRPTTTATRTCWCAWRRSIHRSWPS